MADALALKDETAGRIALGDLRVRRIGFGAMRIWPGVSGAGPRDAEGRPDREAAIRLCRRAVERGVDFFDTADIYGFGMSEDILGEALRPFASEVTIATKA
ncbi:MAG: aldo/keto reductase, partial [Sphingobium sp.]